MNGYLPGFEPPPSSILELPAHFPAYVRSRGIASFREFRALLGAGEDGSVRRWGGKVRAACRRAGLIPWEWVPVSVTKGPKILCLAWACPVFLSVRFGPDLPPFPARRPKRTKPAPPEKACFDLGAF